MPLRPFFASRLNSFAVRPDLYWPAGSSKPGVLALLERAATVAGLSMVDLNYPDHVLGAAPADLKAFFRQSRLQLHGLEMRYYSDPAFAQGAFTHPEASIRARAIDLTLRGLDAAADLGATCVNIWPGQDGFDYTFQVDYEQVWAWQVEGLRRVAEHNPALLVSLEYKPNEPRAFSFIGNIGTTLLAIRELNLPNVGVMLDFCHQLIAGEQPAFALALTQRYSRLLGIHINDGYRSRDDGLMVGSVHPHQTLELLYYLHRMDYSGMIYFDTFPHYEDPVRECETNILTVQRMLALLERLPPEVVTGHLARQDPVAAQRFWMQWMMPYMDNEATL
ncbi:MAG: sugar phosphate isomerase/epimerase [Anaerolineae bacterium]|nr:sugar phosphate isomerase/epimerase [Anaerolineae bacterium]